MPTTFYSSLKLACILTTKGSSHPCLKNLRSTIWPLPFSSLKSRFMKYFLRRISSPIRRTRCSSLFLSHFPVPRLTGSEPTAFCRIELGHMSCTYSQYRVDDDSSQYVHQENHKSSLDLYSFTNSGGLRQSVLYFQYHFSPSTCFTVMVTVIFAALKKIIHFTRLLKPFQTANYCITLPFWALLL